MADVARDGTRLSRGARHVLEGTGHAGGAEAAVLEFRPAQIWEGVPVPRSATRTRTRRAADAVHSSWSNLQAGDSVEIDGVTVATRHPAIPDWERQDVRNDDSVVLELLWHEVSIVLTGDGPDGIYGLSWWQAVLVVSVAGAVMTAVYAGGLKLMRVRELDQLAGPVVGRVRRLVRR